MAMLSGEQLRQAALKRRAIEAVSWDMAAVNFELMLFDGLATCTWSSAIMMRHGQSAPPISTVMVIAA